MEAQHTLAVQKVCSHAYHSLHPSSQEKHTNATKKVVTGKIVIRQEQRQRKFIDTIILNTTYNKSTDPEVNPDHRIILQPSSGFEGRKK